MHTNPLEDYIYQDGYSGKCPYGEVQLSACWRGYVATFEIKDDQLFLNDIQVQDDWDDGWSNGWRSAMNDVFPGQDTVKAEWFSDILVLPRDEVVQFVHMGYATTYERYTILKIEKGNLIGTTEMPLGEYMTFEEKREHDYWLSERKRMSAMTEQEWLEDMFSRARRWRRSRSDVLDFPIRKEDPIERLEEVEREYALTKSAKVL